MNNESTFPLGFLKNMFKKLNNFLEDNNYTVGEVYDDYGVVEEVLGFIEKSIGIGSTKSEFLIAIYYHNYDKFDGNWDNIKEKDDIIFPKKRTMTAEHTYHANVLYSDTAEVEGYLPSVVKMDMLYGNIDFDDSEIVDIYDMYDSEFEVDE